MEKLKILPTSPTPSYATLEAFDWMIDTNLPISNSIDRL
jgi:hypothetical protein